MNTLMPLRYRLPNKTYRMGDCEGEIEPEQLAYYVHCECGLTFAEFMSWLAHEIAALEAIDSECSK